MTTMAMAWLAKPRPKNFNNFHMVSYALSSLPIMNARPVCHWALTIINQLIKSIFHHQQSVSWLQFAAF